MPEHSLGERLGYSRDTRLPAWAQRVADHQYFSAPETEALLHELGIVRIGYRALRDLQR